MTVWEEQERLRKGIVDAGEEMATAAQKFIEYIESTVWGTPLQDLKEALHNWRETAKEL